MHTLFVLYFYIDLTVNVLIVHMPTISIHFLHPAIGFVRPRPSNVREANTQIWRAANHVEVRAGLANLAWLARNH